MLDRLEGEQGVTGRGVRNKDSATRIMYVCSI